MSKVISITLVKSLIYESVKNETFHKGVFDKAVDDKAITLAYHEQAGDEKYQERLLQRGLYMNLEELKTHLSDYLTSSGQSTGDNNISDTEEGDNIILNLTVSDRFNGSYSTSLARLASKYIEEGMLMDWWKPINEKQSALYAQFVQRDLAAIKRCFNKTAPVAPSVPYTTSLDTVGTAIELEKGEEGTISYTISEGAIDDIEARVEDTHICSIGRSKDGFTVKGIGLGHTYCTLYSRHNAELEKVIHIYVTDHR